MLPEQEPPVAQSGAIKWLRENLFSSWLNAILTLVSIYVIWFVLSHILPWVWYGVWDASSLSECREVRNELYGPDAEVACWAVIAERWKQLLFGFYPSELYWRPILALVAFFAAIAPILFSGLPRKLLAFSLVAPFLCYFLLWGGSVWGPVSVAMGFVIGYPSSSSSAACR
jgi:general L-amino acid transport system permease protein